MQDHFVKVAAVTPDLRVADCAYNTQEILKAAAAAAELSVQLLATPELGITGYTCGDLFLQETLLEQAEASLETLCRETAGLNLVLLAGLPLRHRGKLYNCAAVLCGGRLLGLVPKTHLPNYGEFYEPRQFAPAPARAAEPLVSPSGRFADVPFGAGLLFGWREQPRFVLGVELCEDLWAPSPPSVRLAAAGATVLANLSASNETVGKSHYRRSLVTGQSARLLCGYIYADAGQGESTGDLVFAGHNLIAENGSLLAETPLFSGGMACSDLDLERIAHERQRQNTFPAAENTDTLVPFSLTPADAERIRPVPPLPFVPENPAELYEHCETIFSIQANGLRKRMAHTRVETAVVGVSGGLDSALALLVTARAFALLGRAPDKILAVTMPGFGTTGRTLSNAETLCRALGVTLKTIDISATVRSHFADIGHEESKQDVVYENAQARMRTLVLMDTANQENGLVIGTGDLSELALGWATYNGDHMSMYGVNAAVPKTLIRSLVAHEAMVRPELRQVLQDILETPVSPELLPVQEGEIGQQTEELVGPYELHDFFLYYILRWGFAPGKIFRLAVHAFEGRYERAVILQWLRVFYRRFFSQQFKRSCLPDGPKVGSIALSPRGDWRMPSDACAEGWLLELEGLS